jgi:two-component system, NarL family, sensor histidine kinase UhpB
LPAPGGIVAGAMSLRVRLNLLLSVMLVTILVLGTVLVIGNARRAVLEETESTARLAAQLLAFASEAAEPAGVAALQDRLRLELGELENARHLEVLLVEGGHELALTDARGAPVAAPQWFVRLVEPATTELRRPFHGEGRTDAEIVVRADPGDEIAESWEDAQPLLLLVLVVSIIANGLLYFVIGRWLKPVERIVAAMDGIEQGDYRARLPAFELPELSVVAGKFNRMAEVLERSRDENRHLAQQSIAIQEAERRALAHELHDELGQSIAAINAVAASIEGGAARSGAATIAEIGARMHAVVRGMLRRLRPVLLDEFGLTRALEDLVDGWNERHEDAFCRLVVRGSCDDPREDSAISLYRIVQECLTNASKHSGATEVGVELERTPNGGTRLVIADNGKGFDVGATRPGLGLLGMRERCEALGGTFRVEAAIGSGVRLTVELPRRG